MSKTFTKTLLWLLVCLGMIGNGFILYEAVTIPFLRGAGLAQADFELFVLSIILGIPIVIASALTIALVYYKVLDKRSIRILMSSPLVILGVINVLLVLVALAFSLSIRHYGFFWRGW